MTITTEPIPAMGLLECVRPILFATDNPEYEYGMKGSGFIFKFGGAAYLVTAKHVVKYMDPHKVLVMYSVISRDVLPFDLYVEPTSEEDLGDISLFRVKLDLIRPEVLAEWEPLEFSAHRFCSSFGLEDRLVGRGYSVTYSSIDYEKKIIKADPADVLGRYMRLVSPGIHQIEFSEFASEFDLDGFSGSPLFRISAPDWCLAGVLIRGDATWGVGRFVEGTVILEALQRIT